MWRIAVVLAATGTLAAGQCRARRGAGHRARGRGHAGLLGGLASDRHHPRILGIATGPDGAIWFTEEDNTGGVARLNPDGSVSELRAGVTNGFTAGRRPQAMTTGSDGRLWFAEDGAPGGLARVNKDDTVTEVTAGMTSGFVANAAPGPLTTGSDGALWFADPVGIGRVGRMDPNITPSVTELNGGITPGFTGAAGPFGITTGRDGAIWFTESGQPGAIARVNANGTVSEFKAGQTPGFTANTGLRSLATGPDGNLWFTEVTAGSIGRLVQVPTPSTPAPPLAMRDTIAPRFLRRLAVIPRRFKVGPSAAVLRFSLSEPATVTIAFGRARGGHLVNGRCRAPSRANRRHKGCTRYVASGSLRKRVTQGVSAITFSGRIAGRALKPGRYRATAVARDAAGNVSKPSTATLTILKR
jgi:virginiamycin B lyase